jgi:hypothetical protein
MRVFDSAKMATARATASAGSTPPVAASTPKVSRGNARCVSCQYFVQRIRAEMKIHGIQGGVPFGVSPPIQGSSAAEAAGVSPSAPGPGPAVLLELRDQIENKPATGGKAGKAKADTKAKDNAKAGPDAGKPQSKLSVTHGVYTQRDRNAEMLTFRPNQVRYSDMYDGPMRAARRAQQRYENNQIYSLVFSTMEKICHSNMPKAFFKDCGAVLERYQTITEGLREGDRPDSICMSQGFCDEYSYVRTGPHAVESDA